MARKKKSDTKKVKLNDDLEKTVDSLVDEIERTNNFKKIDEDKIDEIEEEIKKEKELKEEEKVEESTAVIDKEKEESEDEEIDSVAEENDSIVNNEDDSLEEADDSKDNKEEVVEDKDSTTDEKEDNKEDLDDIDLIFEDEIEESTEVVEKEKEEEKSVEKKSSDKKKVDDNKTNKYEFKFDDKRLEDQDSLDTSFLEGRIKANSKPKIQKVQKVQKVKEVNKKEKKELKIDFKKIVFAFLIVLVIVLVVVLGSLLQVNTMKSDIKNKDNKTNEKQEVVEEDKDKETKKNDNSIDENIVFVGDSLTTNYDIDEYFDNIHYVKVGNEDSTTESVFKNLKEYVYIYNPSKVILEIGSNDIESLDNESIIDNITDIIKEIKKNRPFARIYIESVYPVNGKISRRVSGERSNTEIEELNTMIKKLCIKEDAIYIDLFSELYDEEEEVLDSSYTDDGYHLNDEGYQKITSIIKKSIEV